METKSAAEPVAAKTTITTATANMRNICFSLLGASLPPFAGQKRNGPSKEDQCSRASAVVQNMLGLSEFHDRRGFPRTKFLREKHGVSTVRYSCHNANIAPLT